MPPLSANAKRIRTIIVAFPVLVVTTAILYRRAYLGEQPRTIPPAPAAAAKPGQDSILGRGAGELGAAPWAVQGGGAGGAGGAGVGGESQARR
ncbi:hypothetical protein Q5752_004670 [Cryptotrichosporon argae]